MRARVGYKRYWLATLIAAISAVLAAASDASASVQPQLDPILLEVTTTMPMIIDAAEGRCRDIVPSALPGPDGVTSLREAVCAANNTTGPVTIQLSSGVYQLTRAGDRELENETGDLNLCFGDISILGAGVTATVVDAGGLDRAFTIAAGASVLVEGLTIQGGRAPDGANGADGSIGSGPGAPGEPGGGIFNAGQLVLRSAAILDNRAGSGGSGGFALLGVCGDGAPGSDGGGIFNAHAANLTLEDVTLAGNLAGDGGKGGMCPEGTGGKGGDGGRGGGLFNDASAWVDFQQGLVENNLSGMGGSGGFDQNGGGPPGIRRRRRRHRQCRHHGGDRGPGQREQHVGGWVALLILAHPHVGGAGGGLWNAMSASLTMTESVIALNRTMEAGQGGGIANAGTMTLYRSKVDQNQAGDGFSARYARGGGNGGGIANTGRGASIHPP